MLLEHSLIQATGFRNFGPVDAREGLEIRIRTPNYRGFRLSLLDGVEVTVDGEFFGYEVNRLRLHGITYTLEEMREAVDTRWEIDDFATVVVTKPGGLTPGIHKVGINARLRSPYFPPQFQPSPVRQERTATIVLP